MGRQNKHVALPLVFNSVAPPGLWFQNLNFRGLIRIPDETRARKSGDRHLRGQQHAAAEPVPVLLSARVLLFGTVGLLKNPSVLQSRRSSPSGGASGVWNELVGAERGL